MIGVSGIDWLGFGARRASGLLPRLDALAGRGVALPLNAPRAETGLGAWASLATGRHPETHGVFLKDEPSAAGLRPVGRASWRAPPVWARLAAAGVSTGGVAWPASRDGADWDGAHIDESYAQASGKSGAEWALPRRCAPDWARAALRERRVHPTDITAAMLGPLVPDLAQIDQRYDAQLPRIAMAMAEASTVQAGAVWMLQDARPAAAFVHFDWLEQMRARYGAQAEGPFSQVAGGAWRFLDALIGRLAGLAAPDARILIVSPGWGGKPGLFLSSGGRRPLEPQLQAIDLLDVAPTVLADFDLADESAPGASRLSGAPQRAVRTAPSPVLQVAAANDASLLAGAAQAGFTPPPPPPPRWWADRAVNLAALIVERSPEQVLALTAEALRVAPNHLGAVRLRATALAMLEEVEELPALADDLARLAPERGWAAMARGAYHVQRGEIAIASTWLQQAEADPDADTLLRVAALWLAAGRPDRAERLCKAILRKDPAEAAAEIGLSIAAVGRRDFIAAEAALRRVLKQDPGRTTAYLQLARVLALTGRRPEADRLAETARRLGASEDTVRAARDGAAFV